MEKFLKSSTILALTLIILLLKPNAWAGPVESRVGRSRSDQQIFSRVVRGPVVERLASYEEVDINDNNDQHVFFRQRKGPYDYGHRIWLENPQRRYYINGGSNNDNTDPNGGYKRGSSTGAISSGIRLI